MSQLNQIKNIKDRDKSIDILRSIAIIGIFLAHSAPSDFWIQVRSFDVVLMVFLSAVCAKGFDRDNFNYFDFLGKRCMRLILPVWIFFAIYYVGVYVVYYLPPMSEVISSFSLTSDRYVWIIRILVILGVCAPIVWKLTLKLNDVWIVAVVLVMLICCELLFNYISNKTFDLVMTTFPYAAAYIIGMNINKFSKNSLILVASIFGISFLICAGYQYFLQGEFVTVSHFKYPPRIYYMAYGLAVCMFLWIYRSHICKFFQIIKIDTITTYIGRHTYWLYLWHIPFVDVLGDAYNPLLRFLIITSGALCCVYIQDQLVQRFVSNNRLATIFNG